MLTMFNLAAYLFRHRAASLVRGTWRRLAWTLWLLATVLLCAPARDALAQAPAGKVYRIGLLSQGQPPKEFLDALQQGLDGDDGHRVQALLRGDGLAVRRALTAQPFQHFGTNWIL